ncbi:MAG: tRNA (adenosine(37)-N6)-dimethylallyltransferase MiaA [Pseudomonadales bacterium]
MAESVSSVAVVIGPTAAGKTAVAMALQDLLGGPAKAQLISADSALVYRGMDIGTAKPSAAELQDYPHQLIDIRDPSEPYSAADFVRDADAVIHQALQQGKTPIIVGGTMLYVQRFIRGIAELPSADPALRENLQQQLQQQGAIALHERLTQLDAVAAAKIHPNNHQRLLRALEVIETTGKAISSQWQNADSGGAEQRLPIKLITAAVVPEQREVLHTRIATRFDAMLQLGFVAEVEKLMQRGDLHPDLPALRAVGYRQAWQFLRGEVSHADFVAKALAATRQLAKRQLTWLRQWPGIDLQSSAEPDSLAEQLLQKL